VDPEIEALRISRGAHVEDPLEFDFESRLFAHLAGDRVARRLVRLQQSAWKTPRCEGPIGVLEEQHTALPVQDQTEEADLEFVGAKSDEASLQASGQPPREAIRTSRYRSHHATAALPSFTLS
jgi:hypothetical protein